MMRPLSSVLFLLLVSVFLSPLTVHGQEILSPAKFYVYKITLERSRANNLFPKRLEEWNVNMVFITGPLGGQIYHTVGTKKGRNIVGNPVYRFRYKKQGRRSYSDGLSIQVYDIQYQGEIIPPDDKVRDPRLATLTWSSRVTGEKSMLVAWEDDIKVLDRDGQPVFLQNGYFLTFHCALVE